MNKIVIGLGWEERQTDGKDFDLDASLFMLSQAGRVRGDEDFIFYNNMSSSCGSVVHQGDNLTGASDGESDEEEVNVDLAAIPSEINKVSIAVSIHDAVANHQNFGQVSNAYIRIVNQENNEEITRYDLTEDYSIETAMIFGELYRHNAEWKFRAVGQGYEGGLEKIMGQFGVDVS